MQKRRLASGAPQTLGSRALPLDLAHHVAPNSGAGSISVLGTPERNRVYELMQYLTSADFLPSLQSDFRPAHSTKTAIVLAVNRGHFADLVLLDFLDAIKSSAAQRRQVGVHVVCCASSPASPIHLWLSYTHRDTIAIGSRP